ncbi:MAG TPA: UDP-glucose/GDP-mannose dehydrogenase family protein [Candidatus Omnitrophota bacterium]|nr:UDP-glucose/GDP-mannose dehydrogenase family protein [Candidatus Omnitrophota bacterium]HOX09590.1 UDP-glucose/GDP-mannose dehydrogenase family protein [Candidatus Omnitrophota bacterium]HPN66218.1 UDP-glucose/GDP-mannose dehydrogenase family protein [Candidatus Omnitrophota bacterium]
MKITVIGAGYVGLVTAACLADLGNEVVCNDIDGAKIAQLNRGKVPIYEPGLDDLIKRNRRKRRLKFTTNLKGCVESSAVIFIAVGTPPKDSGEADLTHIEAVARDIARYMKSYHLVVEKSTTPVETGSWIKKTLEAYARKNVKFDVASNPEFLREGSAIGDFMHPDRIVIGVESRKAEQVLTEIYRPLGAEIIVTNINSAEIIKHASNSFLATKISFINAVANICEKAGADVEEVARGMGLDKRIGRSFLDAGIGFGGFCFPKDIEAFIHISEKIGYNFELLKSVKRINEAQRALLVKKIEKAVWNIKDKKIAMLGLAFKPNTDDMRFAPSLTIAEKLRQEGAHIRAYDPQSMSRAKKLPEFKGVKFCEGPYEAVKGADCTVIVTEWNEFKELDLKKAKKLMRQPVIVDGRNIYDPKKMKELGFRYSCIGRT